MLKETYPNFNLEDKVVVEEQSNDTGSEPPSNQNYAIGPDEVNLNKMNKTKTLSLFTGSNELEGERSIEASSFIPESYPPCDTVENRDFEASSFQQQSDIF
ncbi:unnamed protein product [Vicia faba]|uniref:Uncharacterized protein n=1 Tax=Vicia faba TaxID=3906 RepID=A0AAV1AF44_VICFA|nr:unnamed protein product [Vicia faba]